MTVSGLSGPEGKGLPIESHKKLKSFYYHQQKEGSGLKMGLLVTNEAFKSDLRRTSLEISHHDRSSVVGAHAEGPDLIK